jgi:hypothetical protein
MAKVKKYEHETRYSHFWDFLRLREGMKMRGGNEFNGYKLVSEGSVVSVLTMESWE